MPYWERNRKPFVGVYIQNSEDETLKSMARKNRLTQAQIARACLRAGMKFFEQDPAAVLALAKVDL